MMQEFSALMRKSILTDNGKQELTREVTVLASDISTAYRVAKQSTNRKWTLDKKDIGLIVLEDTKKEEV